MRMWYNFYSSDKEALDTLIKDIKRGSKLYPETNSCFGDYGYMYNNKNPGASFYFGFPMLKAGLAERMVSSLNNKLNNINVEIIKTVPIYYINDKKFIYKYVLEVPDEEKEFLSKTHYQTLYTVKFNPDYSEYAQYALTISMAEIIRMFDEDYKLYSGEDIVEGEELKTAIELSNIAGKEYGNWCYIPSTMEEFLLQDDIKLMNELLVEGKIVSVEEKYTYYWSHARKFKFGVLPLPTTLIFLLEGYLENEKSL